MEHSTLYRKLGQDFSKSAESSDLWQDLTFSEIKPSLLKTWLKVNDTRGNFRTKIVVAKIVIFSDFLLATVH
jgi:hypothetical protein